MEEIFKQYGPTIIIAIVIVALIVAIKVVTGKDVLSELFSSGLEAVIKALNSHMPT